jgi:hypothetical protein
MFLMDPIALLSTALCGGEIFNEAKTTAKTPGEAKPIRLSEGLTGPKWCGRQVPTDRSDYADTREQSPRLSRGTVSLIQDFSEIRNNLSF